jgi:AraC-like DNA-binding protein
MEWKVLDRASFEAELCFGRLGPVGIVRTVSRAATVEHSETHVRQTAERNAFLIMPIAGTAALSCYGREATLEEGDLALSDSFAPSKVVLNSTNQALLLAIPHQVLTLHVPNPDAIFGVRLPGRCGLGHTINVLLQSLWAQAERGLPPQYGQQVADSLLALIATAYAIERTVDVPESSVTVARRAQIKRFIETHLRNPALNAVAIAKALELSPRYVRMVFAAENEHISAYVLRRRLEECARQLCHKPWLRRSITETAFDWGFTSTAYFTRAFKQQFGVTPTHYRHARSATNDNGVEVATD